MKILAVDDDPIILELLAHFIETMTEHKLVMASCADDAIETIKTNAPGSFDCFLLDIQMPGTDGIALAGQIRTMDAYVDTPILMLTAMSEKDYIDAAFAAGATDYVTKPFEMFELKARLALVERAFAAREARTTKIFAAQKLNPSQETGTAPIDLFDPVALYEIDNLIDFMAFENYIRQLSRNDLFGSTAFAFTIRDIAQYHATMSPFEFYSLLTDVAEVISDTLGDGQFLMSYAGNGTFICITESGWQPDMKALGLSVNLTLAKTELFDNQGQQIEPRVCAGEAIRLMWKTSATVMDAISAAHASAEESVAAHEDAQKNAWQIGLTG
ncbi:Response regulator receiver domain-containing protein [Sulfitobacter marinus]|uniref:Response regulator receiver domain-containing protein n=1 Tax=Sulfitobacter marinus TaxID=394264 RepID=A0A1I6VAD7_9RHOB|nr:response regulator [Sulfitobacter marinus]SFT10659.1 Response regulator receiver domain-containing protein [Sulfitobacter marinus]